LSGHERRENGTDGLGGMKTVDGCVWVEKNCMITESTIIIIMRA
jgi:hypothetical protein